MNLINDPWIPAIRKDGTFCRIAPWQIVEQDNPLVELAAPRPDFQGALYQWLIGLLQTCAAPEEIETWAEWYDSPPEPQQLAHYFTQVATAFELTTDANTPAFLQELNLTEGKKQGIANLLIEAPGYETQKNNLDFFAKGGQVNAICPACTAQTLFTQQTNAPPGGSGYRVGLRGGGPLTTLLQPVGQSTLWQKLWLNILDQEVGRQLKLTPPAALLTANIFPWLGATRLSDKDGTNTLPGDVHSLQMYWGMPCRIRLQTATQQGECDLCGEQTDSLFSHYITSTYGTNYEGAWLHPLTPYRIDHKKHENPPLSLKGQKGGLGYRHWLGLTLEDADNGDRAAKVVNHLFSDKRKWLSSNKQLQLWCFGYDMDQNKARCWYDHLLPVFNLPPQQIEKLQAWSQWLLTAAKESSSLLRKYIKEAWYRRPKDITGDLSFIDSEFWQATEGEFYQQLRSLMQATAAAEQVPPAVCAHWFNCLKQTTVTLFDQFTLQTRVEHLNLQRVVTAREYLLRDFYKKKPIRLLQEKGRLTEEVSYE